MQATSDVWCDRFSAKSALDRITSEIWVMSPKQKEMYLERHW